jgi:diacylglycerol kinase (ATP)
VRVGSAPSSLQGSREAISCAHLPGSISKTNAAEADLGTILDRLLQATVNTWNGLLAATRSEMAFRQELVVLALSVPLAFFIGSENWKPLTLIAVVLMVLVVELLNTTIEKLSDFVAPGRDERIGRIKDMGSAAVGLAITAAGLIWLQAIAQRFGWF